MLPKWHVLYGFVFSVILINFFDFSLFGGLLVFLSSVFIDLDHYFIYIFKNKSLSFKNFWDDSMKKDIAWRKLSKYEKNLFKQEHFLFHGIEFFLLIFILSINFKLFDFILLGFILHLILDYIDIFVREEHYALKVSQIWLYKRNKNKKEFQVK